MSNFNGHYKGGLVGAVISVGIGVAIGETEPVKLLAIAMSTLAFALFPDIDIKSTTSKIFYGMFLIYLGVLYYLQEFKIATISSMIIISPQITKHRGIFHSLLAAFLIPSYPLYFYHTKVISFEFASIIWASGVLGYIIHLILDKKFKII